MYQDQQLGGGNCSLCGSPGTNKTTCPLNPSAANPNPKKHPLAVGASAAAPSPARAPAPVRVTPPPSPAAPAAAAAPKVNLHYKVGDEVHYGLDGDTVEIATVTKVTPTTITVKPHTILKIGGMGIGETFPSYDTDPAIFYDRQRQGIYSHKDKSTGNKHVINRHQKPEVVMRRAQQTAERLKAPKQKMD